MENYELSAPVVSIQNPKLGGAVAGHLAWGDLVTPTIVAVRPYEWAFDASAEFEVLLASATADGGGYVERIKPERIEIVRRSPGSTERGAVVWLAQPSNHPAAHPAVLAMSAKELFAAALAAPANRSALRRTSEDAAAAGSGEVLEAVVRWEADHRAGLVLENEDPEPPGFRMWWCFLFGGCWGSSRWW